ncbi:MAG TPA: ATP-binding protein [Planctomycetota bacterium]|nr:ATP-binding protein [Planctomycetota bacterium]
MTGFDVAAFRNGAEALGWEIVDTVRDPLLVLDRELRVRTANRSFYRFFGMSPGEAEGRRLPELSGGRWDLPSLRSRLEDLFRSHGTFDDLEIEGEFPGIGPRTLLLNARFLARSGVEEAYVLLAVEDITDRRRAERALEAYRDRLERANAELARSNADLEQFAYVASHDLQEPLRMVASYTQLLERRYKDALDQDARDFIAFAVDGATRMKAMINDLLAYSRAGSARGPRTEVSLDRVLDDALANLSSAIAESGAVVTRDPLPRVWGDASQLLLVFQNLISNAVKFRRGPGVRIRVSASAGAGEWTISVADDGIGIDPSFFGRLFVVFQRLNSRSEFPGNGIGLATCKRIVERHGGRIWVESSPGKGSTFFFTLPAQGDRP